MNSRSSLTCFFRLKYPEERIIDTVSVVLNINNYSNQKQELTFKQRSSC